MFDLIAIHKEALTTMAEHIKCAARERHVEVNDTDAVFAAALNLANALTIANTVASAVDLDDLRTAREKFYDCLQARDVPAWFALDLANIWKPTPLKLALAA